MTFEPTSLKGVYSIALQPLVDNRGWFARVFCKEQFAQIGHTQEWVQINHSLTNKKGTVRGMHYQLPPHGEIKMVSCIAGAICDVVIDIRKGSDTFLKWIAVELSSANKRMIYIPEGFAHGFQAQTDNCELIYHHSSFYKPGYEGAIRYDDPLVNIQWPLPVTDISQRDSTHLLLNPGFKGI